MSHIVRRARTSVRPWMFIYLSLLASIYVADEANIQDARKPATMELVEISGAAPLLSRDTFVRRSDI